MNGLVKQLSMCHCSMVLSLSELDPPANTAVVDLLIIDTVLSCVCRDVTNIEHHVLGMKDGITKARRQ